MNESQFKQFNEAIEKLCSEYGVKSFSYCGSAEDKYLGVVASDSAHFGEFYEAVINIGRLWQAAREKVKKQLDRHEKKW